MMVKTRQCTKLQAAGEAEISKAQSKSVEEDLSSEDESSSEVSEEEMSEKDVSDGEGSTQGGGGEEDGELVCLPDILSLESRSEVTKSVDISTKKKKKWAETSELSSRLDPGTEMNGQLYFSFDVESVVSGRGKGNPLLDQGGRDPHHELMKKSVITADFEKRESAPPISRSRYAIEKIKKAERAGSTGGSWFDMPAPQLTDQLKNDLRLLRMRNALDPTRHYKTSHSKSLPRYFQVGRVVSGPADFYSGRLPEKQRKGTLLEELLAGEESRRYHKKKYLELQNKFMSGTKRLRNIKHKKKFKNIS